MSSTKAIARSTLWQFGSQIVMAALSIVTTKFVAIALSKELAGNYNTAYGFLQLFGILADFGLYAVAVREVSKAVDKAKVLGTLITLRSIILCLSLGSALAIVWITPAWRGTPLPVAVSIAALVPFFTLLAGTLRTIFQVTYKLRFVFIAEVSQRIVTTLLIGLFVYAGVRHTTDTNILFSFLGIGGLGAFVLSLLSYWYGQKLMAVKPVTDKVLLKNLFTHAAPYGLAFLCTALYRQFDVTLIALLRPDYELQNAYYGFVQRMMDMAYLLPTFLLNSTLPVLAERDAKGEDTKSILGKTWIAILLIGSTAFLFAFLWSRPLTELLTTNQYLSTATQPGSDTALKILAGSMFFNGILLFSFYSLLTKHAWKPLVFTLMMGVVLSFVSNMFLIPTQGFVGASITSVITHGALALLLLPQSLRALPMRVTKEQWLQWAIYSFGLAAGLYLLLPFMTTSLYTALGIVVVTILMAGLVKATGVYKSFT